MGYINQLSCTCGYKVELKIGTGRNIPDAAFVQDHFSSEILAGFNGALKSGKLGPLFYIENVLSYCENCRELKENSVLHYQAVQEEKTVSDFCHACGGELKPILDKPLCPKCGKALDVNMAGLWD